jgi:predicted AlkP superfamily pyrophosphatase or phosphodiesterase
MHKTVVLDVVALTPSLLGTFTPRLSAFAAQGKMTSIEPILPAVTCSVQASYLTGLYPDKHGIVGNGWYARDENEVRFWRQSNTLVQGAKLWETARLLNPNFTCANLFWWFNMYSSVDFAVTPRPMYPADGRKIPDIYTKPLNLRFELQKELGQFPLFHFWGPNTTIRSSRWIAEAARSVEQRYSPTLTLIYLPHLDYCLQRKGPSPQAVAEDLAELDTLCGDLIDFYTERDARILLLSEYGIVPVSRPVHINRELRKHGLITVRRELGRELLDAGASLAFAVADHQIAHIYVNDPARLYDVRELLQEVPGIARVLDDEEKRAVHLNHPRSGDLVALAESDAWFTYYYWLDDTLAPDFARTVDIHRKPGYDPVELFLDPQLPFPQVKIGWNLLKTRLGLRSLLDVIPLDASLVHGSHGCSNTATEEKPFLLTRQATLLPFTSIASTEVSELILQHMLSE